MREGPAWPDRPVSVRADRDRAQTALALGMPGPHRDHDDLYPLRLAGTAVAGRGGRAFEELRSRRSLAYAVSASPIARWLGGAFVTYIGTSPEREDEARSALLHELGLLRDEPLPDADVERAQRYLIGAWQIAQQTHGRQLADLAHALLLGRGLADLREHEQRIRDVDAARIRAAAARWLVDERRVEGIVRGTGGVR
jgi:zinc protease